MAQGSSYGSGRVDTTVREFLAPKFVDTVLRSNRFAGDTLKKVEDFNSDVMTFPIKVFKGTAGQSFSGYDQLPTAAAQTRVKMVYIPKFYAKNISLPKTEIAIARTKNGVIDLVAAEMKSGATDAADDIGTIFQLDGTGNGGKDFLGLQALVDDGTTAPFIGNLSRFVYPTLQGTVTSSGGTLTLDKVRALYNNIADGTVEPNKMYTSYTVYGLFEKILFPGVRYTQPAEVKAAGQRLVANAGFGEIAWLGMDVLADRKIDTLNTGTLFMLNTEFLKFYAMMNYPGAEKISLESDIIEGGQYNDAPGSESKGFFWTGFVDAYNAQAYNGDVILGGELMTDDPRRQGRLTNITNA